MQFVASAIGLILCLFVGSYEVSQKRCYRAVLLIGMGLPFAIELGIRMAAWK